MEELTEDLSFNVRLGRRIRAERVGRSQSQTTVAELLGVSTQQVQKYEYGTNRLPIQHLVSLAKHFKMPLHVLAGLDSDMQTAPVDEELQSFLNVRQSREIVQALPNLTVPQVATVITLLRSFLAET